MSALPDSLAIGSVLWDILGRAPAHLAPGSDMPGRITRQPGGVALNVAAALVRCGMRPALLSAVGRDGEGEALVAACAAQGIVTEHLYRSDDLPTDRYMAIEGAGGLIAAIADAHSLEAAGERILAPLGDGRLGAPSAPWRGVIALDGNLTPAVLARIAGSPLFAAADLRVAPASPGKAERLLPLLPMPNAVFYLNREEAGLLCRRRFDDAAGAAAAVCARGAARVLVTDGAGPAADAAPEGLLTASPPPVPVARVTGAGDCFMAAHIAAERRGADRPAALAAALAAAAQHVSGGIG
ncbi:PfkB family carbohydrate kinase [Albidovulum sp.]